MFTLNLYKVIEPREYLFIYLFASNTKMNTETNDETKSRSMSPLPSNNTTILGEIKTGTPIDLTVDNSIIQQQETEYPVQPLQQPELQTNHQQFENITGNVTNGLSGIDAIDSIELMQKQVQGQEQTLENTQNEEEKVIEMQVDNEEDDEKEEDPIDKMRSMEVLPDLFNLLYELNNSDNTKVTAKDFDKYLGSLRLKLSNFKDSMQQIDNINETLVNTFDKIEKLKQNNHNKQSFLLQLKQKVDQCL